MPSSKGILFLFLSLNPCLADLSSSLSFWLSKNPKISHATKGTVLSLLAFTWSLIIMQECGGKFSHISYLKLPCSHSPFLLHGDDLKVNCVVMIVISLPGGCDWTHTARFCALWPEGLTRATPKVTFCILTHGLFLVITEKEKCKHRCEQHVAHTHISHTPICIYRCVKNGGSVMV